MLYEMAEDDLAFVDRLCELTEEQVMAYLQTLPAEQQQPMAEAILRALTLRSLQELYQCY
jgi:hypothetical protein